MLAMANMSLPVGPHLEPDRLLSYREAANLGQFPERSLRKWVADGTGPKVVAVGRYRRIRVRDWIAWLDTRYASTPKPTSLR
jgi:hypothetical protein